MRRYFLKRLLYMVILLWVMSVFAFVVIQLPPGDYLTSYISNLQQQMGKVDDSVVQSLRTQYGLDSPMWQRYFIWMKNMLQGDFGQSFEWKQSVGLLLATRMPMTILLSAITLLFAYACAIPIGIFSARHQYSIGDYVFSVFGFIGLATPSFFLALIMMYYSNHYLGISVGGFFSPEYQNAPWSFARVQDLVKHLPIPVFVIGLASMANVIRILRATLLDELKRPYVVAARARGLKENKMIYKYPVRVALNPIISSIGSILPSIVSGATVTAIVLDIPTVGSLLYKALLSQDMYLAGASVLMLTAITVVGTFLSDILLVVVDPRIKID
ncbi:ABC transporter permease subunit [Anaerocolumna sedimenticola]|uniref:ABC transporter permease subunit n=1 Tax=Anaerocolumna sedimenticola TaxID=2696063 RepID=A0A6P1TTK1_9FIRM|nr:ABC transporter permease [Anaerocolumna sedimenticola]QHQ62828.1 ABC transporter permease subunit [Anaerocolumna sedimenticola]